MATRVGSGGFSYVHTDHLGGVVLVTGAEAGERRYAAFGALRAGGTGLLYYGARYYDPQLGAFILPDSVVADGQGI